jgi:hypothetical protein
VCCRGSPSSVVTVESAISDWMVAVASVDDLGGAPVVTGVRVGICVGDVGVCASWGGVQVWFPS